MPERLRKFLKNLVAHSFISELNGKTGKVLFKELLDINKLKNNNSQTLPARWCVKSSRSWSNVILSDSKLHIENFCKLIKRPLTLLPYLDGVTPTCRPDDAFCVRDARVIEHRVKSKQTGSVVSRFFQRFCVVEKLTDGLSNDIDIFELDKKCYERIWLFSTFYELIIRRWEKVITQVDLWSILIASQNDIWITLGYLFTMFVLLFTI